MMFNVVRSLPRLEELTVWTSLSHVHDLVSDDMKHVDKLKLGGLNHISFLEDMCFHIGSQLTSIKIETVHCDVDISLLGRECPNIENLNVINARVKVTKVSDEPSETTLHPMPPLLQCYPPQYRAHCLGSPYMTPVIMKHLCDLTINPHP